MEPMFDSLPVRIGAVLLSVAVLYLFIGSVAVAFGVDVPIVSALVEDQHEQERQEVRQHQH